MTSLDGILAGEELGATGQDHLSELRAWLKANPEDQLVRGELRRLTSELDTIGEIADQREVRAITDITGNLPRSLLSVAGRNGAILTAGQRGAAGRCRRCRQVGPDGLPGFGRRPAGRRRPRVRSDRRAYSTVSAAR